MDRGNQIDASLSPECLAASQREWPKTRSVNFGPKRHSLDLLDFRFILTYSTPTPEVHLHIDRFHINWDEGPLRFAPSAKLTKKTSKVNLLLEKTYQKAKRAPASESTTAHGAQNGRDPLSNIPQDSPSIERQSQHFFSQRPAHEDEVLQRKAKTARPHLNASTDHLLQHLELSSLATSSKPSRRVLQELPQLMRDSSPSNGEHVLHTQNNARLEANGSHREKSVSSQPGNDLSVGDADALASQHSRGVFEDLANLETQPSRSGVSLSNKTKSRETIRAPGSSSPRKRQREGFEVASEPEGAMSGNDSPSRKRQRTAAATPKTSLDQTARGKESEDRSLSTPSRVQHKTPRLGSAVDNGPVRANPWRGMIKIATREISIDNDQVELLGDKRLWIPPNPGAQMPQGHVPPSLLRQWNDVAQRRHRLAEAKAHQAASERPITPTQETMDTCHTDSDSPGTPCSGWEGSSPESNRGQRSRLPADSSPVKHRDSTRSPTPIERNSAQATQARHSGDTPVMNNSGAPISQDNLPHDHSNDSAGRSMPSAEFLDENSTGKYGHSSTQDLSGNSASQAPDNGPSPSEEQAPSQPTNPEFSTQAPEDDSDDESMMDTSVPLALGEMCPDPTQSTQAEQDITSSGSSLPGTSKEHVQVTETPAVGMKGPRPNNRAQNQPLPSSQVHKSSSQSRVIDTYSFHGSHEKSAFSQEVSNSSGESEAFSLRVDVPGTQFQTSSASDNLQSANTTQHSQSEVVLDSSGPQQRHQHIFYSGSLPLEPSSLDLASSQQPIPSQPNEPTQDSSKGARSLFDTTSSAHVSPMGNLTSTTAGQDQSPSKGFEPLSQEIKESSQFSPGTQNAGFLAPLAPASNPETLVKAQGANLAPTQCDPTTASSEPQTSKPLPSFSAADPVGNLIASHAGALDHKPSVTDLKANPNTMHPSPTSSVEIKREGSDANLDDALLFPAPPVNQSQDNPLSSIESATDKDTNPSRHSTSNPKNAADGNMSEVEETDTEQAWQRSEEESDVEDSRHETASVELGDDTFVSTNAQPRSKVASEESPEPEPESEDENWFLSLRHMRPTSRVWSDDPNTPFKRWAIADQNVLSERWRRGRSQILVNEKGEIRRPIYR